MLLVLPSDVSLSVLTHRSWSFWMLIVLLIATASPPSPSLSRMRKVRAGEDVSSAALKVILRITACTAARSALALKATSSGAPEPLHVPMIAPP